MDDETTLLDSVDELNRSLEDIDPLSQVPDEEPAPDPDEMLALLSSADAQERMKATRAFCEIEDARAVLPLLELLRGDCPMTRVSAAYALGRNIGFSAKRSPETGEMEGEEIIEPLIKQLKMDWNGYARKGIVWALGRSGDRRALPPLLNALKTDIAAVRLWAASALGQLPEVDYDSAVKAMPPLISAMRQDSMAVVRSNCAWSVGELCVNLPSNIVYATAVDALIETLVEDEDMSVREDAKSALLKLGDPRSLQMIEALQEEGLLW